LREQEDPLSEKHKSASHSQSRTATLIGAGTRIEGNITFTGVLRIDGEIIGDVSCDDTHGTINVGKLGRVIGAVKATHIVVVGRVDGPVYSSESIEIHQGACVVGDASYKDIVIHEGGVVQGVLTRSLPTQEDRSGQESRVLSLKPPPAKEFVEPPVDVMADDIELVKPRRKGRTVGAAIALLIAVVAVVWMNLSPTAATAPAVEAVAVAVPKATSPAVESPAPPPAPVASAAPLDSPNTVTASAVPLAPSSEPVTKVVVQATPPDAPKLDPKPVTEVRGDSPNKPADFVYVVIGKESAVLLRKQRDDPAEGTRISVAKGSSKRLTIAKDDILRVEQGRGIQMFFQGRKVAPATIESGAWIHFVPNSRSGASGQ
jgi:cytoskeletal protein CcmA (bactofilin family)